MLDRPSSGSAPPSRGSTDGQEDRSGALRSPGVSVPAPAPRPTVRAPFRLSAAFPALRHRNFRLFYSGYVVSLVGIWMQRVAQAWLVLDLTGSAFFVGLVEALGTFPVLVFSLYAGTLADRFAKHRMIMLTQSAGMVLGLVYAALVFTDRATIEWVVLMATLVGIATAFDIPARHSFFYELVGKDDLMNAIALNSSAFNASRVVGPAIAGVLIGAVGVGICFLLNGLSFLAVLVALVMMKIRALERPGPETAGTVERIREGLAYAIGEPRMRLIIINIAVFAVFGLPMLVLLPVMARNVLGRGAEVYGWMMSSVGVGAVVGALGLAVLARHVPKGTVLTWATTAYGVLMALVAFVRPLWIVLPVLTLLGFAMIVTTAVTNTLLQTLAPDRLRGRVVSVYVFSFVGMAPFGALQAGVVAERFGAVAAMALGGSVMLIAALLGVVRSGRLRETR